MKTVTLPAPVGGWNARDAYAEMEPTDAVTLINYWPTPTSVALRFGHSRFATGMTGQSETLMAYSGAATNKLFSANVGGTIYDVTSGGSAGNYLDLPGSAGDYASTPDSATLDVLGDIEIIVYAAATDWTSATAYTFVSKWLTTGNQRSYMLELDGIAQGSLLVLDTSVAGITAVTQKSTVATGFTDGTGHWIKVTLDVDDGAGNSVYNFYTSDDAPTTAIASISWTQLGATVTVAATTSIFPGTAVLEIGTRNAGVSAPFNGKIYRAQVYDGIGGTLVADFNANDGVVGGGTLTSSTTGEIYTINGTASIAAAAVSLDVNNLTNGRWQYINVSTTGGNYLMAVNGADKARYYNGSAWDYDGAASLTITGVDSAACIGINLFKNRVWLIEQNTLKAWYLPTGAIAGLAVVLDLRAFAPHGGYLVAMGTWTIDAGAGIDDYAAFITNKGDVIVYRGSDPASASTWAMVGQWYLGSPIGNRPFIKWKGDLLIIEQDGVFALSAALQSSRMNPRVALTDKIKKAMTIAIGSYGSNFGWQILPFPKQNMLLMNVPVAAGNNQEQYVMNTITGAWAQFQNWSANCWELFNDNLYFGGNTYVGKAWDTNADNGSAIDGFILQAFNTFKEPGQRKRVTAMRPLFLTNGTPAIYGGVNWDYDLSNATAALSTTATTFATWDGVMSTWDSSIWGGGLIPNYKLQNATGSGWAGAPVFKSTTLGLELELVSNDLSLEIGGFL